MPTNRSRSASPPRRSASPAARKRSRSPPRKSRGSGGFKWKNRSAAPDDEQPRRDFQDSYRPKRYDGDRDRRRDVRAPEFRNAPDRNPDRGSRYGAAAGRDGGGPRGDRPDERSTGDRERRPKEPGKKEGPSKPKSQGRSAPTPAAPATFIIVTVNDRLGTKASIPCIPTDTVGELRPLPV
jgi:LAS seventeen-binding protein 5